MSTDIMALWDQLTPEHQTLLAELVRSLAALDTQQNTVPAPAEDSQAGLRAFLREQMAAYEAMSPAERAAADAELAEFKTAMNANRAPEPPLFP